MALLAATALYAQHASAEISDGVVKIGVLNDQSGVVSDATGQGSVVAARLAAEEFNNQVSGKPIEIIFADHQNKADIASTIARQWYEKDGVDLIVDTPNSGAGLAVQGVAKEMKKIFITSSAGTTALSNQNCSPYGIQWTYDTYALAKGTGEAVVEQGGKTWYFITADYAFGHQLQADATSIIEQHGGKVLGSANHPLATPDFSSFLLQAQASKAQVVGFANAGGDTIEAIKQATEFGLTAGGQRVAAMLLLLTDVHSLGLKAAQGTYLTTPFYWNLNADTRAWSDKFAAKFNGRRPTFLQIGVYESVRHYLQAVQALGSDDADAVMKKMRETKIESAFSHGAYIRADGRVIRDMYLAQVKTPAESKEDWDFYKIVKKIPGEELAHPLSESTCPLVKKS
ncbi:ABC transporter permease [Aliidongia dinghuensis]|uniref:ABC transporter permease n=2 Tax=Aliidongia dinghuensis TaxID=1867774 RepID=A0A8J3E3Z0_9PROT|nr:ABC transporter permease [Aliidongia dinghuensis]